ncbi:CBY1-interacting BAR domain-containing protein 1-like [Dysidea avara]|uniref:CBY1-interacting BAR domain-containing protein 1-like n=1 Tax=Dysidea avara TaxID=196820 RepID=UPI00332645F8
MARQSPVHQQSAEHMRISLAAEEKYLTDKINSVEKHFAALHTNISGMIRKTARLRDKGDVLAKGINEFADEEHSPVGQKLKAIGECFAALEDFRQAKIDRMEAKVLRPLNDYDTVCRKAKEELQISHGAREKELNKQRTVDRARVRDPSNRQKISQFESSLQKAKIECLRTTTAFEDYMEKFELKKVQDMKTILGEYMHSQMTFHAKALELYTIAYQNLHGISEQEETEAFRQGLHPQKRRSSTTAPDGSLLHRTTSDPSLSGSMHRSELY